MLAALSGAVQNLTRIRPRPKNGEGNAFGHIETPPPDNAGNTEDMNSRSGCLGGSDPDVILPSNWVAEGRGVDEYYDEDCLESDAYLEWLKKAATQKREVVWMLKA